MANLENSSDVYTDTWAGYNGLGKVYVHSSVNRNIGQYRQGETGKNIVTPIVKTANRGI
jgi:hypothetical protein